MAINCLGEAHGEGFSIYLGDTVDITRQMPAESIDFSVYSPPFSNLFVYSSSEADMGNSADDAEFFRHYGFLITQMFRITKPGRLSAVHSSDIPKTKWKDGVIAVKDLSGAIIRAHEEAGWDFACRVTIWKDPVVEMTRTKALGLLHKQLLKDSGRSRTGMPDYLLVFRKPGVNADPIWHTKLPPPSTRLDGEVSEVDRYFPVEQWQEWASPVWMTVDQTNVLNAKVARENADEKHLCPLQLDVIHRALILWSNPGDIVLSPFMGIGSEGSESLKAGRRFIGIELKEAYFAQAIAHCDARDRQKLIAF